jgi:molybdopterin adenylyltransferase
VEAADVRVRILTVSTRAAAGVYADEAGPAIAAVLEAEGLAVAGSAVVPDGRAGVAQAIAAACEDADVVITTGGTGLHPHDTTREATLDVIDREVPGIAEAIRARSLAITPMAALSRGAAGIRGRTLVINVPGSPKGARESVEAVVGVLRHAVDQLRAGDHPRPSG